MFRPSITVCAILLAVAAITCEPLKATAAERTGAELLPQSTVVYAEISQSKRLIETVLNHPLRKKIEALEQVQQQYESQQYKIVQFIITMIEQKIDMKLEEAIAALTEGGVFFGLDAETQGVVLLAKARDKNTLKTIADTLMQIVREQNEGADPFKTHKYRDLSVFQVGEGIFAQMDSWLMLTNKGELAKSIADRFLDGGKSLADDQNFQSARKSIQGTPTLWGYANAELIRDNQAAKQLLREKHDNPAAELLLGGVLSDLQKAPFVTASLFFEKDRLAFNVSMPHDAAWIPERREYFFGADGKQGAPAPLRPKQTVLSIEAHRDVSAWWLGKEDLYEEQVVAKLELADSQFSLIFAGLDFGQEVLGALKPGAQIVLTRQDFDKLEGPKPDIQLPAGAFVFDLKEPDKIWRRLKVSYQSAVGFINIQLGQQGQPQLEMETETIDKARIISASYLPDEGKDGAINYNFSPSIAFVRGRFIIASTRELARELVDLVNQQKSVDARIADNTHARLDLEVLQQILQDNRQQLVTQLALQQGKEKAAAEKEVGIGLDLLSATRDLTIRLAADKDILRFDIQLKFAGANDK